MTQILGAFALPLFLGLLMLSVGSATEGWLGAAWTSGGGALLGAVALALAADAAGVLRRSPPRNR